MSIATATPPDSETEVIISVDENAPVAADETAAIEKQEVDESAAADDDAPVTADDVGDTCETSSSVADDAPQEPAAHALYRHDCAYGSCPTRWSKFALSQEEQDALEDEMRTKSIVQRHVHSSEKGWETESFTINSPDMRAFLAETLAHYQDLDPDLEGWTFAPPYKPLVHRWDRLQTLHQALKDSAGEDDKKTAVGQLVEFMQPILAPSIDDLAATRATGKIKYDMIWQIFPPGEIVLTKLWGVDTVCRVVKYQKVEERDNKCWLITVEYVDWDGEKCGFETVNVRIPLYHGYRRVTSLPGHPLSFTGNADEIKATMMARGRRFQQLRGYRFQNYNGVKVLMGCKWEEEPVTGRVIIDAYAYYRSNNIVKPELGRLGGSDEKATETDAASGEAEQEESSNSDSDSEESDEEDASDENEEGKAVVGADQAKAKARDEDLTALSDEHCLLTTPWMIGFDLKRKKWGRFLIDKLDDIKWNDKAFENLVLPGGEKELAWEFVESKAKSDDSVDDFVPEKGRGIIILMFGPPGVGKTYTAEAVAEKARVPLYLMSAGMLGTSPEVVEPALTHALELCRLWNAMLLLDEADVFLGARLDNSLTRNELVAIFLTKLEYYQGILFLTTNRFSRIDHAFQSRVDLFLPYHDLDPAARKQVWQNFFDHFGPDKFDVSEEDLDRLSGLPLNGREIKNLLKSAQLLNSRTGGKVTAERLYVLADKRVSALKMLEAENASVGR